MTLPASSDANLLEFLQLRSLRRPQSFSQFQLSHRPRLGGSPFLRQGRSREPQAYLGENLKTRASGPPRTTPASYGRGVNKRPPETVAFLFVLKEMVSNIFSLPHRPWSHNGRQFRASDHYEACSRGSDRPLLRGSKRSQSHSDAEPRPKDQGLRSFCASKPVVVARMMLR
jgi:hypothetical protein